MRIKYLIKNSYGFGLIEVLAALSISVIVISSLVSLSIFTLRSSLTSKLLLESTKIANRELELVRAYRDYISSDSVSTWKDNFVGQLISKNCSQVNNCYMSQIPLQIVSGTSNSKGAGLEKVSWYFTATKPTDLGTPLTADDQIVRISVVVSYNIGSETKYTRIYTDLTNWRGK